MSDRRDSRRATRRHAPSGKLVIHRGGGFAGSSSSNDVAVKHTNTSKKRVATHDITSPDGIIHDDDVEGDGENSFGEDDSDHSSQHGSCKREMPRDTSQRRLIVRVGDKFADGDVHRSITDILEEHYDGPWATFRQVPKDVLARMFARFRTLWRWDPKDDKSIYDGFRNVLKSRFRDIMRELRIESKKKAREAGHVIGDKEENFEITSNFPPNSVRLDIWKQLCLGWGSEKWLKKSASGRKNRFSADSSGNVSRHTGGSMGFAEHGIRLERKLRRKVNWMEVFFDTHLTKECKAKFWAGRLDFNDLEGLKFCSDRSKQTYVEYKRRMIELYGSDLTKHPRDDSDVWASVQAAGVSKGRISGMGSSDPHFVVTAAPSTSCGSKSHSDAQRSQEEVQEVRAQLEKKLENERKAREELEQRMKRMESEHKESEERMQKRFEEFMRKFQPPGK